MPNNRLEIIKSVKAKADAKRTAFERLADWCTISFGSFVFLVLNLLLFVLWIAFNLISNFSFDPFPFNLLTMAVSLEAIVLSIIVLISQNRAGRIMDIREEIDLQLDMITEREITKALKLLNLLCAKQGIDLSMDGELRKMLKDVDPNKIEALLEKEV